MLSKCETAPVLTFLDPFATFLGVVDSYFLVKMKINKNKVTHFLLSFGLLPYDWQKSSGAEKKVTLFGLGECVCECDVMDTLPQGIIDSYSYNDVNLTKRKIIFRPICQLNFGQNYEEFY